MDRQQQLTKLFAQTPAVQFLGLELTELSTKRVSVRLPVRNELLIHHGIVAGGMLFTVAQLAGAYAVMMQIDEDEEMVLQNVERGMYLEAAILEDYELHGEAHIAKERKWIDKKKHQRRGFLVSAVVYNIYDKQKADFDLYYEVLPREIFEKAIRKVRERKNAW